MYLGTCGKVAENGVLKALFSTPVSPTLSLLSLPSSLLSAICFGSSKSVPQMDLSQSTLRLMARDTYGTPSSASVRPHFPKLGRLLTSRASSHGHGRITIATPPFLSPSTLDRLCSARRELAAREKFRKVGWRQLNHKTSTTKIIAWAKSLFRRAGA
jgi:DNA-binding LacI/PurR family transcriptional regulator